MKYNDTVTVQSKLEGFEDVKFTLRKFSHGSRSALRLRLASASHEIRVINNKIQLEIDKYNLGDSEPADAAPGEITLVPEAGVERSYTVEQAKAIDQLQAWSQEIDVITAAHLDPAYLDATFVSVSGLTDPNGKPYTAKTLYESGPEALCQEVVETAKQLASMSRKELESFELPTTSGAVAGGPTTITIASVASETSGT